MLNNIKNFGFNVIPEKRTLEQTTQTVENAINGMWEPILGYLKENENVFSGEVLMEIEKLNNQAMRLNMTMNAGNKKTSFDYES